MAARQDETETRAADKPLERYIRILEVLTGFPDGIGQSYLAEILALPKPTTYRLLRSLVETGMVEHVDIGAGYYTLGPRFASLVYAGASRDWIASVSQPLLKDLSLQTDQACFIAKLSGDRIQSVAMTAPENSVRAYVLPGRDIALHAGASAKAILAFQPESFVTTLLPPVLPRLTEATIESREVLMAELRRARAEGVAYCRNEDFDGFGGIAVPILVPGQAVLYAICLTGTVASLFNGERQDNEARLRSFAARLATAIKARLPR